MSNLQTSRRPQVLKGKDIPKKKAPRIFMLLLFLLCFSVLLGLWLTIENPRNLIARLTTHSKTIPEEQEDLFYGLITYPSVETGTLSTVKTLFTGAGTGNELVTFLFNTWVGKTRLFEAGSLKHVFKLNDGAYVLTIKLPSLMEHSLAPTEEFLLLASFCITMHDNLPELESIQLTGGDAPLTLQGSLLDWSRPISKDRILEWKSALVKDAPAT